MPLVVSTKQRNQRKHKQAPIILQECNYAIVHSAVEYSMITKVLMLQVTVVALYYRSCYVICAITGAAYAPNVLDIQHER
eukprot:13517-Heterococcus_DN1.PRE.2